MTLPDYESIMLPLLKYSSDGIEHTSREAVDSLSKVFNLTNEEMTRMYSTKKVIIFYDRVHWALSYLKHAGLLISVRRGIFRITEKGIEILKQNPNKIDDKFLRQFPEFVQFQTGKKPKNIKMDSS